MNTLTAVFTTRPWNPVSYAIRLANPEAIFTPARASHVITLDGNSGFCMEANMLKGVRRVTVEEATKGLKIVDTVDYEVPDAEVGLAWMRATCARKAKYDFEGAFGLGLAPARNWQQDDDWFCFEFHTMGMEKAGRRTFRNCSRVGANMLMNLEPTLGYRKLEGLNILIPA